MRDIVSPLSGFGSPLGQRRRTDTLASVIASIFRDSDGFTTPLTLDQYFKDLAGEEVSENTDPIALALDPSGNENNLTQTSATFRPTLNAGDMLYDGGDDRLVSPYVSGTAGSLFARFNGATASRVLLGAQPATDGRAFLGLDASGRIGAGIGAQSTSVIRDQEADRRNLLAFTEDFASGVWDGGESISSPSGEIKGLNAQTIIPTVDRTGITQSVLGGTGTALCHMALLIKSEGARYAILQSFERPNRWVAIEVDLQNETARTLQRTAPPGFISTPVLSSLGGGVFLVSAHFITSTVEDTNTSFSITPSLTPSESVGTSSSALQGVSQDGISGVTVAGVRFGFGEDIPPYQPILGAALNDLRNAWHTAGVTWDGTTVKLYLDGAEVYSEPQVGAVSGAILALLGALNANGTAAAFWNGRISNALAVDRPLTPAEITKLTNKWST